MILYLASAIDRNDSHHPIQVLMDRLYHIDDLAVYLPYSAWMIHPRQAGVQERSALVHINQEALAQCDAMLIWYQKNIESWGVPMELRDCNILEKPVLLIVEDKTAPGYEWVDLPIYLRNELAGEFCYFQLDQIDQAITALRQLVEDLRNVQTPEHFNHRCNPTLK